MTKSAIIRRFELNTLEEMRETTESERAEYYLALDGMTLEEVTKHNELMVKKLVEEVVEK